MADPYLDRIRRASEGAGDRGLQAVLVAPSADLAYLAGYAPPPLERFTCLVLRPGGDPVLLVPELERPRALASPVGKDVDVVGWRDGDDPYARLADLVSSSGRFGVTDGMWAVHLLGVKGALGGASFGSASEVVGPLRAVKDPEELELLSRAARGADEVFRRVLELRIEGRREEEVAKSLADLLTEHGHDEVTFTIVGSGPNGASPHHEPGDRHIRSGDPVVLDFGGRVGGYCSDISRTVCVGKPPERFHEVYELVAEAQDRAFRAVAPGIPAEEVDRVARDVIESAGYGDQFVHRTGHGIGLEEHEGPYIVAGNTEPLAPGMCFSIEPGIYLEGEFGVRIEDIVAVTEDGAVRLNRASRAPETVT
jgi:Xaa-Pro aminopeptidase